MVTNVQIIQAMKQDILLIDKQGNAITELAMAELMQQGEIKRHIRKMRKIYQQRRDFAVRAFQQTFENWVEIAPPAGGMALWVKFKLPFQQQFLTVLKQLHIDSEYDFGSVWHHSDHSFYIRFGFAALTELEIRQTVEKLYQVFVS